jgi:hypothetical protein
MAVKRVDQRGKLDRRWEIMSGIALPDPDRHAGRRALATGSGIA